MVLPEVKSMLKLKTDTHLGEGGRHGREWLSVLPNLDSGVYSTVTGPFSRVSMRIMRNC